MTPPKTTAHIRMLENGAAKHDTALRQVRAALYASETRARAWRVIAIFEFVIAVFLYAT